MTRDEVVEHVARAIAAEDVRLSLAFGHPLPWDSVDLKARREIEQALAFKMARAAIAAMSYTRGEANRITILESALERIAGMDSVGADVRAHCQTALRRARG